MLRKFLSRKRNLVALMAVAALAVAGGAFAYFTSTGSGSGSAAVGTAGNDITVTGTETTPLTPGGPGGTVSFTASNPNNFNQKLSKIHLVSITPDSGHSTCSTTVGGSSADFSMPDVTVGSDGDLAPNASNVSLTETGTLTMNDTGVSQDGCQGATLTLTFSTT